MPKIDKDLAQAVNPHNVAIENMTHSEPATGSLRPSIGVGSDLAIGIGEQKIQVRGNPATFAPEVTLRKRQSTRAGQGHA